MNTQSNKRIVLWNAALSVLLLVLLGLNATWAQAASDPPVRVYTTSPLHAAGGDGVSDTYPLGDKAVDSAANWTVLLELSVDFTGSTHRHHCAVTASSDVVRSDAAGGAANNRYLFDLSVDNLSGANDGGGTRTVELNGNNGVDDIDVMQVGSTRMFTNLTAGPHKLRWLAKKEAAAVTNTKVRDSSMTVICVNKLD